MSVYYTISQAFDLVIMDVGMMDIGIDAGSTCEGRIRKADGTGCKPRHFTVVNFDIVCSD